MPGTKSLCYSMEKWGKKEKNAETFSIINEKLTFFCIDRFIAAWYGESRRLYYPSFDYPGSCVDLSQRTLVKRQVVRVTEQSMQATSDTRTIGCIGKCTSGLSNDELDQITDNIHRTLNHPRGRKIFRVYLERRDLRDNLQCLDLYEECSSITSNP